MAVGRLAAGAVCKALSETAQVGRAAFGTTLQMLMSGKTFWGTSISRLYGHQICNSRHICQEVRVSNASALKDTHTHLQPVKRSIAPFAAASYKFE